MSAQGGGQDRLRELTEKRKYMGKSPHVRTTRQTLSKNQKKKQEKIHSQTKMETRNLDYKAGCFLSR